MRILIVSEKDAANVSLGKIADKYLERGHEVVVYAMYYDSEVLRYFSSEIRRCPIAQLTGDIAEKYDCIFTSSVAVGGIIEAKLLSIHKPIFTQKYIIDGTLNWMGDICFVPSLETTNSVYKDGALCCKIGIGDPKYDKKLADEIVNRLLFIDSGHYPFGEKGKRELAKTLLRICKLFSDYELWIKPRFLPGDKIITHQNMRHLYDVIKEEAHGNLPENMVLLFEHRDLKELIDSAHTIICMFTSAFVGAYASGKGLIVLDWLPSEDVYDVRWKHFEYTRNQIERSGALINYRDVDIVLPHGIKCPEKYLDFLLAEQVDSSGKICEVTEYLFREFYSKDKFPCRIECLYKELYQKIEPDECMTWERMVSNRYIDCLNYKLLNLIDFRVNAFLDVSVIKDRIHFFEDSNIVTQEVFERELQEFPKHRDECIILNKNRMLRDDIDCGVLLNALFQRNQKEEIKNFPQQDIGAFHLYRGFVAYDEYEEMLAFRELERYFEISLNRKYIKEISDMSNNRMWALCMLTIIASKTGSNRSNYYMSEMRKFYNSLYQGRDGIEGRNYIEHYTCLWWCDRRVNGKFFVFNNQIEGKIVVYGAGILTKRLVLHDSEWKNKIVAFIDPQLKETFVDDIPVIQMNDLCKYKELDMVIVADLNRYEGIRRDILAVCPEIKIKPLVEMNDRRIKK